MGADESVELEKLLTTVRQAVGPIPDQGSLTSLLSLKDLRTLLEIQNKAAADRGDREERQSIRDKEEREGDRRAKVDEENRRHVRIALYFATTAVIALVAFFYWSADATQKSEISKQTLTVVFGGVDGCCWVLFRKQGQSQEGLI